MVALFSNNASSSLANALDTTATSLAVVPGDGQLFPVLGAGDWFMATLTRLSGGLPQREIVKVTARAGDVMTVVRAQEGTSALAFVADDKIDLRITAAGLNSKMDKGGGEFTGPVTIGDKVTMGDHELNGALLKDTALAFKDAAAASTLDYRDGQMQRWAPGTGAQTLAITNWPPSGTLGMIMIEGVNLGAAAITTDVAVNYVKADNTGFATTNSLNTNHGATLQNAGIDFVIFWSRDGGVTRYGKVVR